MKLKLFPLDIVAFPLKFIPLHIFEERYKKLINECINQKSEFGIIYQDNNGLAKLGCTVSVKKLVNRYPDGRMDIVSVGNKIFRIEDQTLINEITVGDITYLPEPIQLPNLIFDPLKEKYIKLLIILGLKENIDHHLSKTMTFELLEMIQLPSQFELELISINSEKKRAEVLNKFFDSLLNKSSLFNSNERFLS
jgi:Lon protease-like protein